MDHPLRPITSQWVSKLRLAWDSKKEEFQDDADEAMQFFNGPYDWMYKIGNAGKPGAFSYTGDDEDLPRPSFCMTINKVAELVQLFSPALYHKNPVRKVTPRQPQMLPIELFGNPNDPQQGMMVQMMYQQMVQQIQQQSALDSTRASLLEAYLNYTPNALDLKTESRWAIDEAMIKGCGVLWSELYHPAGSPQMTMVGSFFDTVDNLLIDPDMECMRDAKWIARRCVHPYWQVEQEYKLAKDSLKSYTKYESFGRQAEVGADADGDYNRKRGQTNDLVVYWKIWSKMGMGGRLSGVKEDMRALDTYGNYAYLVVCQECPFPLNLPPDVITSAQDSEIRQRIAWPTPYWADDSWPFTPIIFHQIPRKIWPMSHIKPGMGELKFLNWAFSFLAGKVKRASRDYIAILKSTSEELKNQIKHGPDYTMIEVDGMHGSIDKMVSFLQHPAFNSEIYKVIEGVSANFDKRTGLTELAYAMSSRQMRSAEEANIKGAAQAVRPEDMANKVEDAMSDIARKEAFAARWHLQAQDVAPILGPMGAQWWMQYVATSNPAEILHQLEYRIEAGSARKPNRERDTANMQTAMQSLGQQLFQYSMQTGDVAPTNALVTEWCKSQEIDPTPFQLQPPPPPQPDPNQQMEQQAAEQEQQMAAAQGQQDMAQQGAKSQQDMEVQGARAGQQMSHAEAAHQQALRHKEHQHQQGLRLKAEAARAASRNGGGKK